MAQFGIELGGVEAAARIHPIGGGELEVPLGGQYGMTRITSGGELLAHGIAESLVDDAALLAGEVILRADPVEELVDELPEHGLSFLKSSAGGQSGPALIELLEVSNSKQALATNGEAADGRLPEPPAGVGPASDLETRRGRIFDALVMRPRVHCAT